MTRRTEPPPTRESHDPGPLPVAGLRMFAPVALGDLQTSSSYLENAAIRLESAYQAGEKFTVFEERSVHSAIRGLAETLVIVTELLRRNELEDAPTTPRSSA